MNIQLFILVEKNFPEWQAYEVHVDGRKVLYTTNWDEVLKVLNGDVLSPIVVQVD